MQVSRGVLASAPAPAGAGAGRIRLWVGCLAVLACMAAVLADSGLRAGRSSSAGAGAAQAARGWSPPRALTGLRSTAGPASYRISGLRATNAAQHYRASFAPAGVSIADGAGAPLRVSPSGLGRPGSMRSLPVRAPRVLSGRAVYAYPGIVASYANGPRGLEQSFDVPRAVAGGSGRLAIAMQVTGGTRSVVGRGGRSVLFLQRGHELRFTGLRTVDATGRVLPSRFEARAGRVAIAVDDRNAVYPIHVDPWVEQFHQPGNENGYADSTVLSADGMTAAITDGNGVDVFSSTGRTWHEQAVLLPPDIVRFGGLGHDLGISGDGNTLIVGGARQSNRGTVWVFTRSGSTWTEQAPISPVEGSSTFGFTVALAEGGKTALITNEEGGTASDRGVWIYEREGNEWVHKQTVAHGPEIGGGRITAISGDGSTAIIGDAAGGSIDAYTLSHGVWEKTATLTTERCYGAALSSDGTTALVEEPEFNNSHGRVQVFSRSGGTWSVEAAFEGPPASYAYGLSPQLSENGDTAVFSESGVVTDGTGTVLTYHRHQGSGWTADEPLRLPAEETHMYFGFRLGLSGDGSKLLAATSPDQGSAGIYFFESPLSGEAPSASTGAATAVSEAAATLHASVDPHGSFTQCHFEYGTSVAYGSSVPCESAPGNGTGAVAVAARVTSLHPLAEYHYRIVATSGAGTGYGADATLETPVGVTVVTKAPTGVTESDATLTGVYANPAAKEVSCRFEYGSPSSFEHSAPCEPGQDSSSERADVQLHLSGLSSGTAYRFRLVVVVQGEEVVTRTGATLSFATESAHQGEPEQLEEQRRAIEAAEEQAAQKKLTEEGYGAFAIESYGAENGTLDVRNPPGTHLVNLSAQAVDEAGLPAGAAAVVGGVTYSLQGLPPGTSVNAKFFLPAGSRPNAIFKYVRGVWLDVTSLATINGNEVTFHVRDGGPGDEDGVANGVIVDPMVPVRLANPAKRPEVGHCVLAQNGIVEGKTVPLGAFSDSKCKKAAEASKYTWSPGFTNGAFQVTGGNTTFETAAKVKITCTSVSGSGEYTGAGGESMQLTFAGCSGTGGVACQSAGSAAGTIAGPLLGGAIAFADAKGTVGAQLAPIGASGTDFADFSCGATAERLSGSVVGQVKTVAKPASRIEVKFKGKHGTQGLTTLEGQPASSLTLTSGSASPVAVAVTTSLQLAGGETIEIKGR